VSANRTDSSRGKLGCSVTSFAGDTPIRFAQGKLRRYRRELVSAACFFDIIAADV